MNKHSNNTAAAGAAIPPSAKDYSEAFYGLEEDIMRIARHVKLANYLLGSLSDRLENEDIKPGHLQLLEHASYALDDVHRECRDLDAAYLATFNDLVSRENAALGMRS